MPDSVFQSYWKQVAQHVTCSGKRKQQFREEAYQSVREYFLDCAGETIGSRGALLGRALCRGLSMDASAVGNGKKPAAKRRLGMNKREIGSDNVKVNPSCSGIYYYIVCKC